MAIWCPGRNMKGGRVVPLVVAVVIATACNAPWSPPTPAEILQKPGQSDMEDRHFKIKAHMSSVGLAVDWSGDGNMTLKPKYALSLNLQRTVGHVPCVLKDNC